MSPALDRVVAAELVPDLVAAAQLFADRMLDLERRLRRARITVPSAEALHEAAAAFDGLVTVMQSAEAAGPVPPDEVTRLREVVGRWLFRSRIWNRAYHKPHGYAGDFMVVEWMYDLEDDPCTNVFQPAIVNCLDHLGKHVDSIVGLWERRRWYADLLRRRYEERGGALRVLDIAAGGARYIRDFLHAITPGPEVHITVVDQDPAATAYCRQQSLAAWQDHVSFVNTSFRDVWSAVDGPFDLILSAGLFDYLDEPTGRHLLERASSRLTLGGSIAITNYHPDDGSRLVKSWLVDWPLVYRDEAACRRLFAPGLAVTTALSENRSLVLATATRSSASQRGEGPVVQDRRNPSP